MSGDGLAPAHVLWTVTASARTNVFHTKMFHGQLEPRGPVAATSQEHFLGSDVSQPLCVRRNGWRVPDVFEPVLGGLIVSERVRRELEDLPHVEFLEVVFTKLVDYPYYAGDFSYYDRPEFLHDPVGEDPERLLDRLPDVPEMHKTIGRYYELVLARHWQVKDRYPDLVKAYFQTSPLVTVETHEIDLSTELLSDYPILNVIEGIMFRADVFERVERFIDWDYFAKSPVTYKKPKKRRRRA